MDVLVDIEDEAAFRFEFPDPEPLGATIVSCRDLAFGYQKDKLLLEGVTCNLDSESRVGGMSHSLSFILESYHQ